MFRDSHPFQHAHLPLEINLVSSMIQMMRHLFQARLSRRIVFGVFASIVLIEAIILLPSVYRRQQELLWHLREISAARVEGGMQVARPAASDAALLTQIERISMDAAVLGGALYRADGQLVGTFGEPPQLSFQQVQHNSAADFHSWNPSRYDAAWSMAPLAGKYVLIIRHNAVPVEQELLAFIVRIAGLVMIVSVFVTVVTMTGLERALITPILMLRSDLLKAGTAIRQDEDPPRFDSLQFQRSDELGEVIAAFNQMYQQASDAIAERKQAAAALRQSEEKFSKAFRASPNPVLISTLADGRLIEVNDSFLQLYGGTVEDVIGHNALELNLWADLNQRTHMLQRLQQEGSLHNLEYAFRTKAGELKLISFSAELFYLNGQECLVCVANDITERKQAERALKRLAEIGELAAMIVHEVRNPLTTVLMGLNSFSRMDLPESAQMRLNLALEEANRLQRLLNEILQYARCQKLQSMKLELNALIHEMLETICSILSAEGRKINFIPAPTCVWILGDRDKLKQVFINLIDNACEAVNEGEVITWSVEPHCAEQEVWVRVHNGGDPIPPEVLARLTQPFYTTKPSGNGLGLAIVRRIVEAHQGELEIESTLAAGTTVSVKLPLMMN